MGKPGERQIYCSKEERLQAAGWLTMHQIIEMRGTSNARACEQGWTPKYRSWRDGFADLASQSGVTRLFSSMGTNGELLRA